jgi:hypothetical protein
MAAILHSALDHARLSECAKNAAILERATFPPAYIAEFDSTVSGIPCRIGVTHFLRQEPLGRWASNDADARGYTEVEFDVLDRRGRPAQWLQEKLAARDIARIEAEAAEEMSE